MNEPHEPWVLDLRQELVERGYDGGDVDSLIAAGLARFASTRDDTLASLLVSRWVTRTLSAT